MVYKSNILEEAISSVPLLKNNQPVHLFVYGTLLRGMSRSQCLQDAIFLGHARMKGMIYDLDSFPGAVLDSSGEKPSQNTTSYVYGELYQINENIINQLDWIEGYNESDPDSSLYIRQTLQVCRLHDNSIYNAIFYLYNGEVIESNRIKCGDYRRYTMEKNDRQQWYIAYGSNMDEKQFRSRLDDPSHIIKQVTGSLNGYELRFNKKNGNNSAYANLTFTGNDGACPIVAYAISKNQLTMLDGYEGVPDHYVRIGISFQLSNGRADLGHIYLANPEMLVDNRRPAEDYLQKIRDGYQQNGFDQTLIDEQLPQENNTVMKKGEKHASR